jgi:sialate O-acetylesterase
MYKMLCLLVAWVLMPSSGGAGVRVASIFGSNMVLQRNASVPVWGTARNGETVTVSFAGTSVSTTADATGRWMVHLPSMKEGGPFELVVTGSDTVRCTNILVGEVWLCSGQSNMSLAVEKTTNAEKEIASAYNPMIRLFTVKRAVADSPQTSCTGSWLLCDPSTVKSFSGAGYYFGRKLQQDLRVPIGLVHSSYGGTPAEAWMSQQALTSDSNFQPILDRWKKNLAEYPEKQRDFEAHRERLMKAWDEASATAAKDGKAAPTRPQEPIGPGNRSTPSGLFNAMIAPIVPFAFKGVIWYQGESNAARAYQYRTLFPALIRDWRSAWGADVPFYYVQLPNLDRQPEPSKSGWAELREAQLFTLAVPKTAMAVTIDIGDPTNLHPQNKQDVGYRLALLAEGLQYGGNTESCQSPIYRSSAREGNRIRIRFEHAAGLHPKEGKELKGFVCAGEDKVFVPAQAAIDGTDILVWNDAVSAPASVRYGWADNPPCNLVNGAGLPASPFRTDDWHEVTYKKK